MEMLDFTSGKDAQALPPEQYGFDVLCAMITARQQATLTVRMLHESADVADGSASRDIIALLGGRSSTIAVTRPSGSFLGGETFSGHGEAHA